MGFIMIARTIVGVGDYIFFNGESSGLDKDTVLAGDLLIIIAQFLSSLQMILQEKLIKSIKF